MYKESEDNMEYNALQDSQESIIEKRLPKDKLLIIYIRSNLEEQDSMQELLDILNQLIHLEMKLNANSLVK
jgi:hypothetical protein